MENINEIRSYMVVKANVLIQQSRFNLTLQEQKIIVYLISKIKPEDMELKEHMFSIQDFCTICGLDSYNGKNYLNIKKTLKGLSDKSIWIATENGAETILRWIDTATIRKNSGTITLKISDMMKPYLLQLKSHFTRYELLYTLAMQSSYSLRLYELLKSYEFQNNKVFDLDSLKLRLSAETYSRFPDFKRRVLDPAVNEINNVSDLSVTYELTKKGKKVDKVAFEIKFKRGTVERAKTWKNIFTILD